MRKYLLIGVILTANGTLWGQSAWRLLGGYNQSIFYCSQPKTQYRYNYRPYDSYSLAVDYRHDLSARQKNLQLGAQLEYRRQSQYFYYEDEYAADTFATSLRYDIPSLNFYFFPELYLGTKVKFFFSGGPVLQVILPVKAVGTRRQLKQNTFQDTPVNDKKSADISGVCLGIKVALGVEIPLYKGLHFTFYNAYNAGLTGMQGALSKRMKYFNCIDINVSAGLSFRLPQAGKR